MSDRPTPGGAGRAEAAARAYAAADAPSPNGPPGAASGDAGSEADQAADEAAAAPGSTEPGADHLDSGTADVSNALVDAEGNELSLEEIDVAALLEERQQFLDALQRTVADFDNFRKQSQKRLDDEIARRLGAFVERLLPVLDAIDAAREHGSGDVDAVASALYGFLEREGLERIAPADEPFDPNEAEAVMHEPSDGGRDGDGPVVAEVLRTGYRWQGRVLRPAMVKVRG